ncbi:YheC/YheD family protein [Microaerobacter geothermalis]|uniref:YheC/YheD family endospore coat-associated protein n=1 Tax=Microaerobacter geothermalis TaxID=674972 RepID=UPI001F1F22EC|nr:YheC/YheD family protein [Microaerobacter geothermalis]MCF6094615.1 YheC/YheD family protein [Microaerobacter geothermalis]
MVRIGVLIYRYTNRSFEEKPFLADLTKAGMELGVEVFIFSPQDVSEKRGWIKGDTFNTKQNRWETGHFPLPDIIYDRLRYHATPAFQEYIRFRKYSSLPFMNNRLASKWKIHQLLYQDPSIKIYLPETVFYQNPNQIFKLSEKYSSLFLKPINGTGGRHILKIKKEKDHHFSVLGRNVKRHIIVKTHLSPSELVYFVNHWIQREKTYILQQGLNIQLENNRVSDVRVLIQKTNGEHWGITGMGVRTGQKNSVTSNLHGGGSAEKITPFLQRNFDTGKAMSIIGEIEQMSKKISKNLESHFGRLVELGLDIGVDKEGKPWLIEINPKPARKIFLYLKDKETYILSLKRPLLYGLYLIETSISKRSRTEV